MKTKNYVRVLVFTLALAMTSQSVSAAWGDFDTTFGFLGASIDQSVINHYPTGVAVQPDGKILVTGHKLVSGKRRFFLRRYLSNGQIDTSFGNNGSANWTSIINVTADYYGERIVVQDNGRIAVSGHANNRPAIWRFTSSGAADGGIGGGGMKVLSAYPNSSPSIATYANILYVGVIGDGFASTAIIKFNSNGSQDMSFGTNGEALTDAINSFSVKVDPTTGNILINGRRRSDPNDYGVERFLTTGLVDPTFTHWGAAYAGWIASYPNQFVRLANGQFVLNERWFNISGGGATLGANFVRLSSGGAFTSRTQYEPITSLPGAPEGNCPDIMEQQQDGKLVLKGMNSEKLYRFSSNFSTIQTMSCASYVAFGKPMTPAVLQSDDKMVAAGRYNGSIGIVRTLP